MARRRRTHQPGPRAHGSHHDALVADLCAVLDADRVRTAPLERAVYAKDAGTVRGDDPPVVCLPVSTEEVAACVRVARRHGRPFVARGSGTGLAGGATPLAGSVVIATAKMDRVLEVDADEGWAWVQPGLPNLDLSRHVAPLGLHYAPDPSSQQSCSIGGNVATNAGGPHCLAYGVTSAHVLAVEVVLPDGTVTVLGGLDPEPVGLDLRGAFVGGEGTLGIATRICVRLTPLPPVVRTLLVDFTSVADGAATVSAIIAGGLVPAAIEMMDAACVRVVEDFAGAGYPLDAAAVLIVEVDGAPAAVDAAVAQVREVALRHGARDVRVAADDAERARWWKGRKSAFGAVARIKPDYYLHDTVVPRARLVEVLDAVYAIAAKHDLVVLNVFHAGDGNLHPLLVYDRREPGVLERVHAAGAEIVAVSVAVGGVLSGEHGIGIEKRDLMPLTFSDDDLHAQARLRCAFDPDGVANPHKVLPSGHSCADVMALPAPPEGTWI